MMNSHWFLKNQKGMSIVMVMVISGVTMISLLALVTVIQNLNREMSRVDLKFSAKAIVERIDNVLTNSQSLLNSANSTSPPNPNLRDCILVTGSCSHGGSHDFTLVDPTGEFIAGTPGAPVRYDRAGTKCSDQSQGTNVCPFIATIRFVPDCGVPGTCSQAQSIAAIYIVQIDHPTVAMPSSSVPSMAPITNIVSIETESILLATNQCGPNSFLVSYNSDGSIACRERFPASNTCSNPGEKVREIQPDGSVVCEPILVGDRNCPTHQKMIGLNTDGTVICDDLITNNSSCPPGQKIVEFRADGSIRCADVLQDSNVCPAGEKVVRVNSDGTPICGPIIPSGQNCPEGQAIFEVTSSGSVVCGPIFNAPASCPVGQRMIGINANGSVVCRANMAGRAQNCPSGQYVRRITADGRLICIDFP